MTLQDILKGEGPNVILLLKDEGEYKVFAEGPTLLSVLKELNAEFDAAAKEKGTTLDQLLKKS